MESTYSAKTIRPESPSPWTQRRFGHIDRCGNRHFLMRVRWGTPCRGYCCRQTNYSKFALCPFLPPWDRGRCVVVVAPSRSSRYFPDASRSQLMGCFFGPASVSRRRCGTGVKDADDRSACTCFFAHPFQARFGVDAYADKELRVKDLDHARQVCVTNGIQSLALHRRQFVGRAIPPRFFHEDQRAVVRNEMVTKKTGPASQRSLGTDPRVADR
jgi:hypothetical protein